MPVIPQEGGADEGVGLTAPRAIGPIDRTGFFSNIGAGYEEAQAGAGSTRNRQNAAEARYYDQMIAALDAQGEQGEDYIQSFVKKDSPFYHPVPGERVNAQGVVFVPVRRKFRNPYTGAASTAAGDNPLARFYLGGDTAEKAAIWAAVARVRQRRPDFLKDLPDENALAARASADRERRVAEAQRTTNRASGLGQVGRFIGNLGGSLMAGDPENFVGGGQGAAGRTFARTVIQRGLREGAVNAAAGTVALPGIAVDTERMGGELTVGDAAKSVAEQAALGFVLGATPPLVGKAKQKVGTALSTAGNAALDKVAAHLPAPMRDVVAAASLRAGTVKDREALGEWRRLHSPYAAYGDTSTPDERAAAHVVDRDIEVQEASPFKPESAADHEARMAAIAKSLGVDLPPPQLPSSAPIAAPTVRDRSADAPAPRRGATYEEALGSAEGSKRNPDSTADGHFQFTEGTWLEYAPKVTNTAGMSRAAILALRHDKGIATLAERRFRADNARYLRGHGVEDSPGNLSLAHFLGRDDATRVLKAAPDTPIAQLVHAESIRSNPRVFAKIRTAEDMVAWAHRRIGSAVDAPVARGDAVPEIDPFDDIDYEGVRPYGFEVLKPDEVQTDAGLMQYKSGGDEEGVTDTLKGVQSWNPILSQQILVWEAKDGRKIVVDGHQRTGLAKRLFPEDDTIRLPAVIVRELDGITAQHARVLGALRNIINGTGTLLDNARVLRDAPAGAKMLPPNVPHARESFGLSRLSYEAFGAAINDVIDPAIAAQIGLHAGDLPDTHMALTGLLLKEKITNPKEAAAIVRQARADGFGTVNEQQLSLMGDLPVESLYVPIARILDGAAKRLREDKRTFKTLAAKAGKIEEAGNVLARAANEEKVISSDEALAILNATAYSSGPVRDALIAAARAELSGARRADAVAQFLDQLAGIDLRSAAAGLGSDGRSGLAAGEDGRGLTVEAPDGDLSPDDGPSLFDQALDVQARAEPFSDPVGPGAKEQTALLEHDLRAQVANDDNNFPDAFNSLAATLTDTRPSPALYQPGDFLTMEGQVGKVVATNADNLVIDFASGERMVSRTDPALSVAPPELWGNVGPIQRRSTRIVYHGTDATFDDFDVGRGGSNQERFEYPMGFFTTAREEAAEYGANIGTFENLSKKPLVVRTDYRPFDEWEVQKIALLKRAKDEGFDSIVIDGPDRSLVVALDNATIRRGDFRDLYTIRDDKGRVVGNATSEAEAKAATRKKGWSYEHSENAVELVDFDKIVAESKLVGQNVSGDDIFEHPTRGAFTRRQGERQINFGGLADPYPVERFIDAAIDREQSAPARDETPEIIDRFQAIREAAPATDPLDGKATVFLADMTNPQTGHFTAGDGQHIVAIARRIATLNRGEKPGAIMRVDLGEAAALYNSARYEIEPAPDASGLDLGEAVDPAVAERQRQEAQLKADSPLRSIAEQEGTMGLGLFDSVDQPSFRLDEEGGPRTLKDILDEADADETAAKNARDCLK